MTEVLYQTLQTFRFPLLKKYLPFYYLSELFHLQWEHNPCQRYDGSDSMQQELRHTILHQEDDSRHKLNLFHHFSW
jgi:hypothetical protein